MTDEAMQSRTLLTAAVENLLLLMAALRTPETGCPWDLAQDFDTIAPYTIEEAYEVADAIARDDLDDLRDELGDLLLQVVFHSRLAEELGAFRFEDVVEAISAKLVRRHPHVFGKTETLSPKDVKSLWETIKTTERRHRTDKASAPLGVLDGIALALPALIRAGKLARKAAAIGFTWADANAILVKVEEELAELREAIARGAEDETKDELGDVIFTMANLARHLDIDPEDALRGTNRKFERRFRHMEAALGREGRDVAAASLDEMERLWIDAKAAERGRVSSLEPPSGTAAASGAPSRG